MKLLVGVVNVSQRSRVLCFLLVWRFSSEVTWLGSIEVTWLGSIEVTWLGSIFQNLPLLRAFYFPFPLSLPGLTLR
jgi:hypothetical protein